MNENNTNGGPGNEAKGPRPLDFNGTEIRPGLWAIEDDELQRIGNAAYQAGRGERDASASYVLGYEAGRVAGRGDSDIELKRKRAALEASSKRVEELRAALETTHQREMEVARMLGCGPADVPQRIGTLLRSYEKPNAGEVAQLREALELASQQQAKIAAALGLEPGEDVLAEVQGVAEILRKSCAALGIHAEHAADLPSEIEKLSGAECDLRAMANWLHIEGDLRPAVRVKVADLIALRNQVVKGLGADAEEHFALVFNRYVDSEVEKRAGRIDAARLRAVEALKQQDAEHGEAILKAFAAAETRTRKACADQVNAAQAMIDRATKEHEEERVKLHTRIAEVLRERDESRSAHAATLDSLRQTERKTLRAVTRLHEILGAEEGEQTHAAAERIVRDRNESRDAAAKAAQRLSAAEAVNRGLQGHIDDTIAVLGGACGQSAVDLAKRVVRERDESRASHANTVGSLTDFKGIANAQREELVEIAELTAKQESETFAAAVRRVVHERTRALQDARWWKSHAEDVKAENSNLAQRLDAREKAGRAERDATARTVASLQRAREDIKQTCEANGRFVLELRTVLDAHPTESNIEAARRVVAERDAATKAKLCSACGAFSGTIRSTPGCSCGRFWIGDAAPPCPVHGPSVFEVITSAPVQTSTTTTVALREVTAGEMVSDRDVMPVVTFGVGQW